MSPNRCYLCLRAKHSGLASTSSGAPNGEMRSVLGGPAPAAGRLVDGRAKPDHDGGEGRFIQGGSAEGRWGTNKKQASFPRKRESSEPRPVARPGCLLSQA